MQNFLIDIAIILRTVMGPFAVVPWSALTVLLISVTMAFITNMVNKQFIDYERLRRNRAEVSKWQEMKREAAKATDERVKRKLLLKVKRKERYITKIQGDIGKQSFMPMLVTIVPFILIFTIMNGIFIDDVTFAPAAIPGPVLISPLNFAHILGQFGLGFGHQNPLYGIPIGAQGLLYIFWYMICSLLANMIWQRVLGTSMTPT
jgi:uncharacterized membrane protein (DUF106 family)